MIQNSAAEIRRYIHGVIKVQNLRLDIIIKRSVSEMRDGEDLWQWSHLEIRLNAFRRSTIPQKLFIIIITDKQQLCFSRTPL